MATGHVAACFRCAAIASIAVTGCGDDQVSDRMGTCDAARGLFEVTSVVEEPDDACRAWVGAVHGRAVRVDSGSFGSASIWASRTDYGTAVLVTAGHVMSPCDAYFSDLNDNGVFVGECAAALVVPAASNGEAKIRMSVMGGGPSSSEWSAHFPLYHPTITMDEVRSASVPPGRDFAVYVVDGQVFEPWPTSEPTPGPVEPTSPAFFDPDNLTTARPSWSHTTPGEAVLVVGYPERPGNPTGRLLHASAGIVLSDEEAEEAIAALAQAGDIEGSIPYAAEAEMIIEGHATFGMSGSGVFDADGSQVGVVVRASFADVGRQFVRAVRMRHIVGLLSAASSAAPSDILESVTPFFPPL